VIDPGEEGSRIIAFLNQLRLFPRYIVLTHGHFDHIGAVPSLAAEYGKVASSQEGAPSQDVIAIHAADAEYLGPNSYPVHCHSFEAVAGDHSYIDALWEDMPPPDRLLAEGDTIGPFTVLHLPGHTPGSIGLWDKKAGVLFSGDTLFCAGYGRTDLPGGSSQQLSASLKRLFALDGNIQVYPGHGPATSIGREAARGMEIVD
jgi:glyoxylase-like metal-dependent hydrolase (beta-lactamase superfamily II)